MPAFCAACISFSSGIGLSQMPFLISAEIFPKKVHQWFLLECVQISFSVSISDSIHMYFVYPLFLVVDFVCYRIHISHSSRAHRIGWMLVHFRNNMFIKCNTRQLHNSRNSRQIIWGNNANAGQMNQYSRNKMSHRWLRTLHWLLYVTLKTCRNWKWEILAMNKNLWCAHRNQ